MGKYGRREAAGAVALGAALGIAVGRVVALPAAVTLDGLALVAFALGALGVIAMRDAVCESWDTVTDGRNGQMKRVTVVRQMSGDERNGRAAASSHEPPSGTAVRMWAIDGEWRVWSAGPKRGTVWLQPADDAAREVVRADHAAGAPVIFQVHAGSGGSVAVAVRCVELRNRVRGIA